MNNYINHIEEQIKDKKHIVITGSIGSGKSTLINELRDQLSSNGNMPGIITWNVPHKAVYMRKLGDNETVMIGEFNPNCQSLKNRMSPVFDGFNLYGVSCLERLINENSDWVMIDEIGFLESECHLYLAKLNELFENKRVIAAVRKQDIKHINDIIHRDDALVIDLDRSDGSL